MTIFQQMNDCNGDAAASEQRVIGSSISHSVTITHSEEFARSVKVSVEGGTGLFEKILASAKIKIGLVTDAGKTFFDTHTTTCCAVGPDEEGKIDRVTGSLKMM